MGENSRGEIRKSFFGIIELKVGHSYMLSLLVVHYSGKKVDFGDERKGYLLPLSPFLFFL